MHRYTATDASIEIKGASALHAVAGGGLRPTRIPDAYSAQVPETFMQLMADAAAGVRLRFRTTATQVTLTLRVSPIELAPLLPQYPAYVDLVVDGQLTDSRQVGSTAARLDLETGRIAEVRPREEEVRFNGLPAKDKVVEAWLPHTAVVDIIAVSGDTPLHSAGPDSRPRWVHHGSSISHCLEAAHPTDTWPGYASRLLDWDLHDLAFAGNAMLDPFVARTIRDAPADVISVKIGINLVNADAMRLRAFVPALDGFLDTIRDGHPDTPLVVISPIACPIVENHPGPTVLGTDGQVRAEASPHPGAGALTLTSIRTAIQSVVGRRQVNDPTLTYLDGRSLFGQVDADEGLLPDGLHPNREGYVRMAVRFAQQLTSLAQDL